ncbi:LOW QUALITY PROTEIN: integrin alpha-PS1-like [Macrobrachium nipponense]|uniref:LOW QUALITY PROTEIN: integrin alpha-PS1-like n=1 Tax=Macrobrachium nipponense TaxID=159736 RepID=UPI0030C8B0F9
MAIPCPLLALLLCFWSLTLVCSFNLEPRIPIVKKGSPKSHFGYTVAQHQTILDTASGVQYNKSWLLVGAPKDQNLQPGTNRSGALWNVPLTTYTTDCEQVKTDGFKDPETGLYNFEYLNEALAEPAEDEIKDDQWLGVTLKSQGPGGKVLVCAHRYMHKGRGFQWGFGLCYVLSQTLDLDSYLEPCRGKPVNEGHQQYGFCQAGTSGLLLEDEAVLGVPGPYTWRGTVHTSNISDNFLMKDKTQYFGPVTENDSPVDKYSYLGYSVTAGRFFGNYMSYVGGAPRANETGQVVFFSREKIGESLLRVDLILKGEIFASSYGFEVLGVDINGDRRDDLVVGAPFYYTPKSSGAVYVYMNNDGGFKENHPFTRIEGAAGESRFGFSMTSLGDLNRDGFNDVAIGAPYEGRGAIYIYLGTRDGLFNEPSQVIHAEDMPGIPYDAFGYALSGGMDLDGNGYPDLLTSSFCSDRVLLIRARPVIDIYTEVRSKNLENIDPTKKGCTEDISAQETCFSFDACFKMDNDAGTRTGLKLKYTIEEISDRPLARVRFDNSRSDQPSIVYRDINLRPEDMGVLDCHREIVYLLDGPRNILQPLKFKLSYEIVQREPRPVNEGDAVPDIDDYPILNQQEALRYFDGTFAKDCGDDDICVSDLDVKGRLDLQRHEQYSHYILRLGEQDTVSLHVEVTNTGEPAYQSSLFVTHHPALAFDLKESQTGSHQCSSASKTLVQCSIGNPLVSTSGPLVLSFKESGYPFDSKYIEFAVAVNSSSREENAQEPLKFHVEVIKKAEISIIGFVAPEQAFYGGEVVGESAIKHMDQVGMELTHKYVIDNRGPWRVNQLQVEVLWPHQVENNKEQGKWLLYMTEVPTVDGIGECEIDPSYVNPLILRRHPLSESEFFTGLEVEGEQETTGLPHPGGKTSDTSRTSSESDLETTTGGVKITKTTTHKKVTTSTTVKKQTTKSSTKDVSVSADKTSHGSSSSSSSTSRVSFSGHSETGPVDDEDGSGYGIESGRMHGRAHSRVSRRVYTTEHRTKFDDRDLGLNELDTDSDDEDGDIVSHHEESRFSTRTSPDGMTTVRESHHESRKETVKEGSFGDIPGGKWNQDGGFHRGHDEISVDTANIHGRTDHNEGVYTHKSGQREFSHGIATDDIQEGSGSLSGFDRDRYGWRTEDGIHKQRTTIRKETFRTHSGTDTLGRGETRARTHPEEGAWEDLHSVAGGDAASGVDSGGAQGGFSSLEGDRTVVKTHSGDTSIVRNETEKHAHFGSRSRGYSTYGREGMTREDYPEVSRTYPGGIAGEEHSRAGFTTRRIESEHRGETFRTHGGEDQYRTYEGSGTSRDYSRSGVSVGGHRSHSGVTREDYPEVSRTYPGGITGEEHSGAGFTTHRIKSEHRGETIRTHDGEDQYRTYEGSGTSRDYSRSGVSLGGHRSHSGGEGSSGTHDFRRVNSYASGGTTTSREGQVDEYGRSSSGGFADGTGTRRFDWNDRTLDGPHTDGYGRDDDRFSQEGTLKYSQTHEASRRTKSHRVGTDRHHSSTYWRSNGDEDGSRKDSTVTSHTNLRTTELDLNTDRGEHNQGQGAGHLSSPHRSNNSFGHRSGGFGLPTSDFDNMQPDENGTYTRVEVDPVTGTTTVYTKKVYKSSWQDSWDRRPYVERSSLTPDPGNQFTRSRRELTRVKREKELIIKPQAVTDEQTGKTMQVVNLRCDGDIPTAKCFTFRCNIRNLGARQAASIRIKSRLWNSTLVEDYPRVSYVSIKSKASLILPEDIRNDQDRSDDVASAETLAYPDLLDQLPPEEVPLWVILVSIFAGLLVLIIIVLILWKLGFFERKRPDPTLSGNLDKDANGY